MAIAKRILRREIRQLLVKLGVASTRVVNETVDAIFDVGRACVSVATADVSWIANPDGTYYTKALYRDRRAAGQWVDETYLAHHERHDSLSRFVDAVGHSTVTRSRRNYIEAWWSCDFYTTGCAPSVAPRR